MTDSTNDGRASADEGLLDSGSQAEEGLLGVDGSHAEDGLLGRLEVIEAQPLEQRAARFDQLAEELLAELQRSDREPGE
ncbi:MAG: hypothetical protein AB7V10_01145 [Leucobacter sp.]|jgi:hypothetical protein